MGLKLMTLLMQVCLTAIAFPSDGSAGSIVFVQTVFNEAFFVFLA